MALAPQNTNIALANQTPTSWGPLSSPINTTAAQPVGGTAVQPGGYTTGTSGNGMTSLETAGLLGGIGLLGAGYAQQQNNSLISPITQAGAPFVGAGQQLLGQAMNQQLTPAQQQVVSTSQQQGQTLINAATPVGQAATTLYNQFASGQLNAGDQAALDQQVTAAKAQIAQSLGPNVDSTTLQTYYDQIDQQALITKQTMLNSYLSTGNQAFDTWAQTTEAGQQTMLQGQQYAVTQIDNTFQQALSASQLGGSDLMEGINAQMQSNTQLANAFSSYMGNVAKGFAQSAASGAGSAAGSAVSAAASRAAGIGGSPSLDQSSSDQANQAIASDTSAQDELSQYESNYQLPQINVPGDSDVMSQISPDFSSAPSYESPGGYY